MDPVIKQFSRLLSDRTPEFWLNDAGFRRIAIFIVLYSLFGIIALAVLNYFIHPDLMLLFPPLIFLGCGTLAVCVWMLIDKNAYIIPSCILAVILICYGCYMMFAPKSSPETGMCMLILFPPVAMLTMGLRNATYALIFLLTLLVTALFFLDFLPEDTITPIVRVRFIYTFIMSMVFSGAIEFVRFKTCTVLSNSLSQLKVDALTDPLTGLGNRRDFYSHISWMFHNAKRTGKPFALAMVDIDFFKKINDTFGHDVGDQILLHLVGQIGFAIRGTDRLFRWGGEEFIVVMADTGPAEARFACERIRQHIQQNPYIADDMLIPYTVSLGVHCSGPNTNIEELIIKADQNLYMAKRSGRNRVQG